MEEWVQKFRNPTAEYRGKPFWAWNGKLEKEELLRQVSVIDEMGFGGFFMHSRTGLATPYLGEEWFSLINACADEAEKRGLEAWLYDEDRWPSGTCGGEVSVDHAMRMRSLCMTRNVVFTDDRDFSACIAAFEIDERDGIVRAYRRLGDFSEAREASGELVRFDVREAKESSFYNGQTYIDTMAAEPTRRFLKSTHERYVQECGERIGRSVRGIFTDEPHRGGMMTSFGDSGEACVPFTPSLPERFLEAFGYDVLDKLPELFLVTHEDVVSPVKWQYVEMCERLFLENYAAPIDAYCRENGMILTGHILHENNLTSQTAMSGSVMRYYEYIEYPGIDFLGEHERCYWIAKQLSSVARQMGQKRLLSEMYGCTGWQMRLENYKNIGDWQALYGINLRCPHLSWYTMEGQAKRDYPASILHQSSWWREWSHLESYYARIAEFEAVGERRCRVLVLNPVESVWARVRVGWCDGLAPRGEDIRRLEQRYEDVFSWLQRGHIDFDYGDEGMIEKYGETLDGVFQIGFGRYQTVVISGMDTIRSTTLELLKQFVEEGGRLVVCGEPPKYRDCLPFHWQIPCARVAASAEGLRAALAPYAVDLGGEERILCQQFDHAGTEFYALLNDDREHAVQTTLRTAKPGTVTRFDPETGNLVQLGCFEESVAVPVELSPGGLTLLTVGRPFEGAVSASQPVYASETRMNGPVRYELSEPNVCVLDYAEVSVNGGAFSEPTEILRADRMLRDAFGLPYRGGEMLQPWFVQSRKNEPCGRATLRFRFRAEYIPDDGVALVLENPELWRIQVNEVPFSYEPNDFYWADVCMKAVFLPKESLRIGENEILVETDFSATSNCEAMYLLGSFGVRLDASVCTLVSMPETVRFGDVASQGFPFYSGSLTYLCPVEDARIVRFEQLHCACVRADGNGRTVMLAWRPYEANVSGMAENGVLRLTAVGSRRNTFGPLHVLPVVERYIGPDSFETKGEFFTDSYSLIPFGLSEPVFLK